MRFRKLRIAWSVGCAIACVLLIWLWLCSYAWRDSLGIPLTGTRFVRVVSSYGKVEFKRSGQDYHGDGTFLTTSRSLDDLAAAWTYGTDNVSDPHDRMQWRWERSHTGRLFVHVPYWFLVATITTLNTIPWIHWSKRFSYVGACQVIRAFTCLPSGG
jgi:hypothetical protein